VAYGIDSVLLQQKYSPSRALIRSKAPTTYYRRGAFSAHMSNQSSENTRCTQQPSQGFTRQICGISERIGSREYLPELFNLPDPEWEPVNTLVAK
jgi:hypothetical protein